MGPRLPSELVVLLEDGCIHDDDDEYLLLLPSVGEVMRGWKEGRWRGDGGEMEGRWRGDGGEMEGRWRGDGGEMEGRWREKMKETTIIVYFIVLDCG